MTIDKNHLRKLHGIPTSTEGGEPSVIARRRLHEAVSKWCAKWLASIHLFFGILGFVVVFLPAIVKPWRLIIENTHLLSQIFYSYSSLSGLSIINLYLLILLFIAKGFIRNNRTRDQIFPIAYDAVVRMEIYPKSRKEEAEYWLNVLFSVASVTLWLLLPFGVLAFFILMKG